MDDGAAAAVINQVLVCVRHTRLLHLNSSALYQTSPIFDKKNIYSIKRALYFANRALQSMLSV